MMIRVIFMLPLTIFISATAKDCRAKGMQSTDGQIFEVGHLQYQCVDGTVQVIGCRIDDKRPVKLGAMVTEGDTSHRCVLADGGIEYRQVAGGSVKYAEYGRLTHTKAAVESAAKNTPIEAVVNRVLRLQSIFPPNQ